MFLDCQEINQRKKKKKKEATHDTRRLSQLKKSTCISALQPSTESTAT
jgi:hypothetical protein